MWPGDCVYMGAGGGFSTGVLGADIEAWGSSSQLRLLKVPGSYLALVLLVPTLPPLSVTLSPAPRPAILTPQHKAATAPAFHRPCAPSWHSPSFSCPCWPYVPGLALCEAAAGHSRPSSQGRVRISPNHVLLSYNASEAFTKLARRLTPVLCNSTHGIPKETCCCGIQLMTAVGTILVSVTKQCGHELLCFAVTLFSDRNSGPNYCCYPGTACIRGFGVHLKMLVLTD